jgi:uncharacterized protein
MSIAVQPIRRDIRFKLPADRVTDWHGTGQHVTQFLNTMSLFFPVGERFFIDSVRHFRDHAKDDPELKAAITAFIGQEAMHGREHEEMNEMMEHAGMPAMAQEKYVLNLLNVIQKFTPKIFQLSATVSLEHLTAILGGALLENSEQFFEGAEPRYKAIWQWHALEETEHKAVAYDLYAKVMGKTVQAYALRTITLPIATGIFLAILYPYYMENLRRTGGLKGGTKAIKGLWTSFQYQWGKPGILRQVVKPWLDWFKPGFHPWDHDNSHFLKELDSMLSEVLEKKAA